MLSCIIRASQLPALLKQWQDSGVKAVFVDTPPAISETIREVVQLSDLFVVPMKPSPHDLRAVVGTLELVEKYDKPVVFVINAAVMRARLTGQAAVALSQYGTVAPVTVHHRVDFAAAMIDGRVARELSEKSRSAEEITLEPFAKFGVGHEMGAECSCKITPSKRICTWLAMGFPLGARASRPHTCQGAAPAPVGR